MRNSYTNHLEKLFNKKAPIILLTLQFHVNTPKANQIPEKGTCILNSKLQKKNKRHTVAFVKVKNPTHRFNGCSPLDSSCFASDDAAVAVRLADNVRFKNRARRVSGEGSSSESSSFPSSTQSSSSSAGITPLIVPPDSIDPEELPLASWSTLALISLSINLKAFVIVIELADWLPESAEEPPDSFCELALEEPGLWSAKSFGLELPAIPAFGKFCGAGWTEEPMVIW